ncbi:MAG: hypothetical protein DMF29_10800 [Verrucomicrobia bacterium]|nr:MAG: hypothetical protein DMF29_10800 [Verrucomicrobiota bacterium]
MRLSRSDAKQNGRAALLICKAYAKRRLALQAASDQCFIGRYKNFRFLTRPNIGILLPGFGTRSRGSNARNIQSVSLADLTKLPPAEAVFTVGRMARKKQIRRLASLPSKTIFQSREHKTARLAEILRGIAVTSQTDEPQVFYPVRDVAGRFHMSTSVVAKAYGQLEDEGLLSTVRGSKTVLQGIGAGRRLNVLGFIGTPAAVPAFVGLQDYRTFFIRVRRELRARGFAVAMVLFDPAEMRSRRLEKRIVKYEFDTVLWYRPDASARAIISRLKDAGVRMVAVGDYALSPIHLRYEIRRETAINQILHYWRTKAHITSVAIVRGVRASAKEEILQRLLEQEQLPFEFRNADSRSAAKFLESLGRPKGRGVIFPSWAASMFAFREPEGLMQLADTCHIAFTGGPPSIPFAQVRDVHAELVMVD